MRVFTIFALLGFIVAVTAAPTPDAEAVAAPVADEQSVKNAESSESGEDVADDDSAEDESDEEGSEEEGSDEDSEEDDAESLDEPENEESSEEDEGSDEFSEEADSNAPLN